MISIEDLETSLEQLAPAPADAYEAPIQDLETLVSSWKTAVGIEDVSKWVLGDIALEAIRSAQANHPDATENSILKEFSVLTGDEYNSMRVYSWVSKKFPSREQRKTGLSWTHYRVTVATDDPEAWINVAIDEHLSTRALEQRIKEAEGGTNLDSLGCSKCTNPIDEVNKLTLYHGGSKEAVFCSYECMGAYAIDICAANARTIGAYNNSDTEDLDVREEQFA